jgi:hypothetical protein
MMDVPTRKTVMNYHSLAAQASYNSLFAAEKVKVDAINERILTERQHFLDARTEVGLGDVVVDGAHTFRVAHEFVDRVQLTDGRFGASFYLGQCYLSFSGGLCLPISKLRLQRSSERRKMPVWFFSEDHAQAHNSYHTSAWFPVWTLLPE